MNDKLNAIHLEQQLSRREIKALTKARERDDIAKAAAEATVSALSKRAPEQSTQEVHNLMQQQILSSHIANSNANSNANSAFLQSSFSPR